MGWGDGGEGVKWAELARVELVSVEAEKLCRRRVVVATRQSSSDAVLPSSASRGPDAEAVVRGGGGQCAPKSWGTHRSCQTAVGPL